MAKYLIYDNETGQGQSITSTKPTYTEYYVIIPNDLENITNPQYLEYVDGIVQKSLYGYKLIKKQMVYNELVDYHYILINDNTYFRRTDASSLLFQDYYSQYTDIYKIPVFADSNLTIYKFLNFNSLEEMNAILYKIFAVNGLYYNDVHNIYVEIDSLQTTDEVENYNINLPYDQLTLDLLGE